MRLLMITQDFPPETGGIQTYAASHAAQLVQMCDWFGVICPRRKGYEAVDLELPYSVYRYRVRNDLLFLPLLKDLSGLLHRKRVDAVFHTQWQTVAASLRARKRGWDGQIFVAAHARELLFNPYRSIPVLGKLFLRYRDRLLSGVDHFYPVSDYTAGILQGLGIEPSRMSVVINGTDPSIFFPASASDLRSKLRLNGKQVVLTITRLVQRKGIDLVLQALPKVLAEFDRVHYLIVGDGAYRRRLERMVEELNLQEHVTFTGTVAYNRLNSYYNAGDLFVMPSRTELPDVEGFGIVFLEAGACGLPVIGSDSGGIPSAIRHGVTGYIVPEAEMERLPERILSLLRDPVHAGRLGENGRARVESEANWPFLSRKLFDDFTVRISGAPR